MAYTTTGGYPLAAAGTTPPIYPTGSATPTPAYAGTFIPILWSTKLIEKFYASTVLAAISNTDYEGEIKNKGDTVVIRTKPTITIKDYRADGLLEVERPSSNIVELKIDKGKYFNLILDDVYEVQSDLNMMNMWSDDAAQQFKIVVDTEALKGLLGQADTWNKGLTAGVISKNINLGVTGTPLQIVARNPAGTAGKVEIVDLLVRLGQTLDEQNIPETGRWVVLPSWVSSQIKMSELRDAALTGDSVSILRNGRLGMVDRFTIYVSNLLPSGVAAGLAAGEWVVYAGTQHALTFASQINKVETLRSEMTFGQILRGLQVYGSKVLDGKALAQAIVTRVKTVPALETVGQYLEETRRLLQDEIQPYRYPDDDLVDAMNIGLMEARRLRADLFLPLFDLPWFDPANTTAPADLDLPVTLDPMYRSTLVYYVVGRMQLRDDEPQVDTRAASLLQKFTAQLLTINS